MAVGSLGVLYATLIGKDAPPLNGGSEFLALAIAGSMALGAGLGLAAWRADAAWAYKAAKNFEKDPKLREPRGGIWHWLKKWCDRGQVVLFGVGLVFAAWLTVTIILRLPSPPLFPKDLVPRSWVNSLLWVPVPWLGGDNMGNSALIGPIIGAIATVVGAVVGSIITLKVTRQQEQEREVQRILEELQKVKNDLKDNHAAFDRLKAIRDDYLDVIENMTFPRFYAEYLSQPHDGNHKKLWDVIVPEIRSRNQKILLRLDELTNKPELSPTFSDHCHDFRNHANEWERMWKLAMDGEPAHESSVLPIIKEQQDFRRRFPSNFESSLEGEIARLKNLFGKGERGKGNSLMKRIPPQVSILRSNDPPNGDPLHKPRTAFDKLDEERLRAERDLVHRYQAFVAELLRLSLLGIAVFGYLYKIIFEDGAAINMVTKVPAAIGVLMFGLSAGGALIFRYFATEGLRFYIEALRFTSANGPPDPTQSQNSLDKRKRKIRTCVWSKAIAAATLGLGAAFEAFAFFLLLL
jgi:hypothetical protein